MHSNFTLQGSTYRAVYHHRWSHFSLDWKTRGITALEHFSLKGEQPQEQALRAALGCKMNCKQLLLLCLPYKCLSEETQAIMEGCSVVPANWLSPGWITALPVTSLFQWMGPTLWGSGRSPLTHNLLQEASWGGAEDPHLPVMTALLWNQCPLEKQQQMVIGICSFFSTVTIFILPSYLDFESFQKAVWYLEREGTWSLCHSFRMVFLAQKRL